MGTCDPGRITRFRSCSLVDESSGLKHQLTPFVRLFFHVLKLKQASFDLKKKAPPFGGALISVTPAGFKPATLRAEI